MIGIDGSRLSIGERTGTETYSYHLLSALARLNVPDAIRVYLNADRVPADLPSIGEPVCIPFPRLWTHLRLSWEMQRQPPDVLFVPSHVVPLRHPHSVVTIHDLGYLHFPDAHSTSSRRMLHFSTLWSARVARRIIAISESTKRDLITHYRIPARRIQVIPHGVDPQFQPASASEVAAVKQRLALPDRYLLFVGTIQPRKNLGRLATALSFVAKAGLPHHLVIAGKRGWFSDLVETDLIASGMLDRIHLLGYVAIKDLPALYSGAEAFVFPSLYEGFGLPILEAMACGTPVVTSSTSALPEVAGDAAILVDPLRPAAIGNAITRLLTERDLRDDLVQRGKFRAASFSWDRTAAETLETLRAVRNARR